LARLNGLPQTPVVSGVGGGFRLRARLAIRGHVGSPKLGLFELDSHRVVHIPNCRVHHPLINRVASVVRRALVETKLTCYSDRAHLGLARYLQVVVERSTETAQVVLVVNSADVAPAAACLDLIVQRLGSDLHSLWFNGNCTRSNIILGADFVHWCGPRSVVERFGGSAVHYPPGAFGQSNLGIAEKIIDFLRARTPPGARVMEYYAGVGAIGLSLLPGPARVTMNEVSPQSLHGLELGIAQLDAVEREKITVLPGEAGAAQAGAEQAGAAKAGLADGADAQVVIADPPRKGLDPALTQRLCSQPPERFLYVSCSLDSLCRDAAQLTAGGKLRLVELAAFNLLPYTEHVETVARFERASC